MKLDLHCHSTASDGEYTPTELVCKAKKKGLEIFSLTDHDSISGLDEAYQAAMKQNVRFVPGIEISAQDFEEIHILGYNIDYKDPFLAAACEEFRKDRDRRGERICDYLKTHNMIIDMGAGASDIAVLSSSEVIVGTCTQIGGDYFDDAIIRYLRKKHNLLIGDRTAEEVKITLGSAVPPDNDLTMHVTGRNLISGLPKTQTVSSLEIYAAWWFGSH